MAVKAQTVTLTSGVVSTVTLTKRWHYVTVTVAKGGGTEPVYFRTDGTDPAVAGDEAFAIGISGTQSRKEKNMSEGGDDTTTVVKIIQTGTAVVNVVGS